ncbi:hypothetical protein LV89_00627 [Arcicella aurantiaca]|uniref:DUF6916 domain-containing protein n=1 Tax=Arcicella aurantiaca TaxID=591202 RepID=A0A316EDQ9_9BACT|nr:hypothetical protein [Arcicella aurantiaca]PWK29073.1 hypothetical protein LV89_00627 [Arcicella aurantiaca]
MELQELTHQDFKGYLNQNLKIKFSEDVTLPAELVEVVKLKGYTPLEREPFLLTFRTQQQNEYYQQGTFVVEHPILGEIPMFLGPMGFDNIGMKYEAVFS